MKPTNGIWPCSWKAGQPAINRCPIGAMEVFTSFALSSLHMPQGTLQKLRPLRAIGSALIGCLTRAQRECRHLRSCFKPSCITRNKGINSQGQSMSRLSQGAPLGSPAQAGRPTTTQKPMSEQSRAILSLPRRRQPCSSSSKPIYQTMPFTARASRQPGPLQLVE